VSELVGYPTVGEFAQALGGNGRTRNISAEPLEPFAIEGLYRHTRVKTEALDAGTAFSRY
jgi:hypothetical protein